jgi:hypothetical protein
MQALKLEELQVGLRTLQDAGYVMKCHANRALAIFYGEIGASLVILEAGYNLDSFLWRYQGVDWREPHTWECNAALSPLGKRTFDGITAPTHELVFPKLKGSLLKSGVPSHFEVQKISQWIALPVCSLGALATRRCCLNLYIR